MSYASGGVTRTENQNLAEGKLAETELIHQPDLLDIRRPSSHRMSYQRNSMW